eukprot:GILK01013245.1.p1 GENE.GILK01013245.1~~GILK01013245.1.p1  ORF type:complete len:266 (-),score=33.85 GILK01013245.1:165-872(-)
MAAEFSMGLKDSSTDVAQIDFLIPLHSKTIPDEIRLQRSRSSRESLEDDELSAGLPPYDSNVNYYQEFWRLYLGNEVLMAQMKQLTAEKNDLQTKVVRLETTKRRREGDDSGPDEGRKKHQRRPAALIDKIYKCPYENCPKSYGSEGSLNLHIKLKHNGGNKTERDKVAKAVALAKLHGLTPPPTAINLPPGASESVMQLAAAQAGLLLPSTLMHSSKPVQLTSPHSSEKHSKRH